MNGHHLGGIGHEQTSLNANCGIDVDGGGTFLGTTVYLPCMNGTIAVRVGSSPATLHVLWSARSGGGPPIVAAGEVWSIGQDGVLYGLDRASGAVRQRATISSPINHFPTPSVGDGLLLAPGSNRVYAFSTTPS